MTGVQTCALPISEKDKDWWGDKEKKGAKPTKTLRQIAGKKDSGAKHDDEDEDKK